MLRFDNVVLNDYYFIIIIIIISEFYEFKGTYVVFKFSNKTRDVVSVHLPAQYTHLIPRM